MMVSLLTHICVTWPQWVKCMAAKSTLIPLPFGQSSSNIRIHPLTSQINCGDNWMWVSIDNQGCEKYTKYWNNGTADVYLVPLAQLILTCQHGHSGGLAGAIMPQQGGNLSLVDVQVHALHCCTFSSVIFLKGLKTLNKKVRIVLRKLITLDNVNAMGKHNRPNSPTSIHPYLFWVSGAAWVGLCT